MTEVKQSGNSPTRLAGVVLKAVILFLVFNLAYAALHADPGWFLVISRGRYERFPALWIPDVHNDGSVSVEREMFSNMDLLFASHVLTREKAPDEFRVFVYGDSSVWGTALYNNETLPGLLNQMDLRTCSGQRIVAYNLGYPSNSTTKDLLFMQKAQGYSPDLNVWLFSMLALQQVRQDVPFVVDNPLAVLELMRLYDLPHDTDKLSAAPPPFLGETLTAQRRDLNLLARLQASSLLLDVLGMDDPRAATEHGVHYRDAPKATEDFFGILPPATLRQHLAFETLPVATEITNGRIIHVSEPIEISTGEFSAITYNSTFPRWAYDQYSLILHEMADDLGWTFLDLWNLVPEKLFGSSIFHLLPEGETLLAGEVAEAILDYTCP